MLSNETNDDDSQEFPVQQGMVVLVSFAVVAICVLNISIVAIMLSGTCIGKPILNIHILSLSISDLLIGLALAPLHLLRKTRHPIYSMCLSFTIFFILCFTVSTCHVCLICIDRCWLLRKRVPSSLRQAHLRFRIIVGLSWLVPAFLILIPLSVFQKERSIARCDSNELIPENYKMLLRYFSVLFVTGIVIISGCSVWVIRLLLSQRKTRRIGPFGRGIPSGNAGVSTITGRQIYRHGVAANVNRQILPRFPSGHVRAAWTIAVLGTLSSALLLPMALVLILEGWLPGDMDILTTKTITIYIACLHSALDPIIYSMRIPEVINNINAWKRRCFRL